VEEKKHNTFTAADIEKYHKGLLSPKEMHELEKAALEDPFLADALEGYGAEPVNTADDLAELQRKLQQRVSSSKIVVMPPARNFQWWRVAAAVVILGGIGFVTFKISTDKKENSIAAVNKKNEREAPAQVNVDSNKITTVDSTSIAKSSEAKEAGTTPNSVRKSAGKFLQKKIDTTNSAIGVVTTVGSVALDDAKDKEQKKDSVEQRAAHEAAAPMAVEKVLSRAAKAEGVVNDQGATRTQSQWNNFTGRVVDASKNAIPFANITNTRDNVGTYADARGYFSLTSPDSILNVRVRSVGFENGLMRLKNNTYNQLVLQDDKTPPDKIAALKNTELNQSRAANMQVEEPEPVDGWTNYNRYIANNINVPTDLKSAHENGQVQVSFDVNDHGEPVNVKVDKSLCNKCDEEAVRLVKQGPKWRQKNKKTKRAILTIPFRK
jgi:carboxypeptidase-like protein/TonB-like protein